MKVPSFADIGKQANDLLYGSGSKGVFQYDTKITLNMKSVEGVTGTAKALKKGDDLSTDFKLKKAQKVADKNTITVEAEPALKKVSATYANDAVEGLKAQIALATPGTMKSVKVTTEYAQPYVTTKAVVTAPDQLQRPVFDLAGAAGYNGWVLGGACQVRTQGEQDKGQVDKVLLKAAYIGADFAVTAATDAKFTAVTGTYWQQLDAASSVAAEVMHKTDGKDVALNMGYCHLSPASGNMYKVKFGTEGNVHVHHETKLRPDTTVAISALVNALKMSEDPKVGFAVDHSP